MTRKSNAPPGGPHFGSNSPLYGAQRESNARELPGGGGGGMGGFGIDWYIMARFHCNWDVSLVLFQLVTTRIPDNEIPWTIMTMMMITEQAGSVTGQAGSVTGQAGSVTGQAGTLTGPPATQMTKKKMKVTAMKTRKMKMKKMKVKTIMPVTTKKQRTWPGTYLN